jgi:hypothetical protein
MRCRRFQASTCLVLLAIVGQSAAISSGHMRAKAYINCTVINQSAFGNTYKMYDNVAKAPMNDLTLPANGKAVITLKSSQATDIGYGSFKCKKSDSQTWNNFDLINDGETQTN